MTQSSQIKVRIPPSPTGPLHLGTARTALYNLLFAQKYDGKFVFRLEDTDRERSKSIFVTDIIAGLKWLGISWDEGPLRQSEHKARHAMVVQELINKGLAYQCFCTTSELEEIKASQRAMNQVEGYDNRHRNLTESQKEQFKKEGKSFVIRFKLPDKTEIKWKDLIRGEMVVNTSDLGGDPVIAKENGDILYNFAVVIDDHDAGITHIIRGEDHLHNTAKQIPLYMAMNWDIPHFAHVPLILTAQREKLSKRKHGDIASISNYIQKGYLPEAIVNYLVAMSWQFPDGKEVFTLEEAIRTFELSSISKSPAIYDPQKLHWFCKEHFKRLSSQEVLNRAESFLREEIPSFYTEYNIEKQNNIISLLKDGLITLSDLIPLIKPFCEIPDCIIEKENLFILEMLAKILEEITPDSRDQAQIILNLLSEKTGIKKGKNLFVPIRVCILGIPSGPDLASVFNILGKDRLLKRLKNCLEKI